MDSRFTHTYVAFHDHKLVSRGNLIEVARKLRRLLDKEPRARVLILNESDGTQAEVDLRGTESAVAERLKRELASLTQAKPSGPGRPKLGVVAKEVTLLPRHWEWLARQPGGASSTLRKLVEEAQKKHRARDELRDAQETAYRFMTTLAGDLPLYEDALRALYAKNKPLFETLIAPWPKDLRELLLRVTESAFGPVSD